MNYLLRLLQVIWITALSVSNLAYAEKIKAEFSYYEDKYNLIAKDNLPYTDFTASDNIINRPFGDHSHWLKIKIKDNSKDDIIIRVKPTYLDKVELYEQKNSTITLIKTFGDARLGSLVESNDIAYRFELPDDNSKNFYYLKVNTTSNVYISAEVLTKSEADDKKIIEAIYLGIYFGVAFIFLTFSIILLNKNVSILTILLTAGIILSTTSLLLRTGAIDYLSKQTLIPSNQITTLVTGLAIIAFITFLNEYIRVILNNYLIFKIVTVITITLSLFILYQYIVTDSIPTKIFLYLGLVNYSLAIYVYLKSVIKMRNTYIKVISTSLLILGLYNLFLNIGVLGGHANDSYIFIGRNIAFYVFFSFMVINYIQQEDLKKRNLMVANQSKDIIAKKEKNRRFELEKLISILLHEIKTPLSIIQLSIDNLKNQNSNADPTTFKRLKNISESADLINSIIIKSSQFEKENYQKDLEISKIKLSSLIFDITSNREFERVNFICDSDLYITTNSFTFEIIMNNLIDNAYKHSPPNTPISIKAELIQENLSKIVKISIENSLYSDQSEISVFKFKSTLDSGSGKNLGLGLWLINELCKTLGITISNQISNGIVQFKLVVPA